MCLLYVYLIVLLNLEREAEKNIYIIKIIIIEQNKKADIVLIVSTANSSMADTENSNGKVRIHTHSNLINYHQKHISKKRLL